MTRPALLLATALVLGAAPAAAQQSLQADACRNEAERFAATFTGPERSTGPTTTRQGTGTRAETNTAPGGRAGTTLSDEDRQQLRRRVDEARAAADRGDTEGCLRNLREARTAARQAGFGGGVGGSAAPSQGAGSSGGSSGSGSLNTDTAGSRPPGAPGAAGSTPGSAGRGGTAPGSGAGSGGGGSGR